MKNNKITAIRLGILFALFLFFSFGGLLIGPHLEVILPIFNCEYVGAGTTRGICIAIIDFNKYVSQGMTFFMGVGACLILMLAFGRLWCGYVCPFGFFQDIVTCIREKLKLQQVLIPEKLKPVITVAKWYIVMYIVFNDLCKVCPVQFFTVPITGYVTNTSETAFFWAWVTAMAIFLNDRAFCKVCPIGALLGLCNKVSGSKLKKCGNACTHCRACLEVCPMDIQEVYEDREHMDITHPDCVYCMKCIEVCPEKEALRFELFGKKLLESKRETDAFAHEGLQESEVQHGTKNER